jgi:peptide/nickel transport system permease protein
VTLAGSVVVLIVEGLLVLLAAAISRAGGVGRYAIARLADAFSAFPAWPLLILVTFGLRSSQFAIVAASLVAPAAIRIAILQPVARNFADRAAKDVQRIIILLSTLGFFGYGTQPPTPSLGNMMSGAISNLEIAWWVTVVPAAALFAIVLSIELLRRLCLRGSSLPASFDAALH